MKVCFPAQLRLGSRYWTGSLDREVENPWLACQRVRMSFYASCQARLRPVIVQPRRNLQGQGNLRKSAGTAVPGI